MDCCSNEKSVSVQLSSPKSTMITRTRSFNPFATLAARGEKPMAMMNEQIKRSEQFDVCKKTAADCSKTVARLQQDCGRLRMCAGAILAYIFSAIVFYSTRILSATERKLKEALT